MISVFIDPLDLDATEELERYISEIRLRDQLIVRDRFIAPVTSISDDDGEHQTQLLTQLSFKRFLEQHSSSVKVQFPILDHHEGHLCETAQR